MYGERDFDSEEGEVDENKEVYVRELERLSTLLIEADDEVRRLTSEVEIFKAAGSAPSEYESRLTTLSHSRERAKDLFAAIRQLHDKERQRRTEPPWSFNDRW